MENDFKRVISFDIDGILVDYPKCWLKYIEMQRGSLFFSTVEAKEELGINEYEILKFQYRMSDYKYSLDINVVMLELNNWLYENNFEVIVSTSRPIESIDYPNMKKNIEKWLDSKGFYFSRIIHKSQSIKNLDSVYSNVLFHIDDEVKFAKYFSKNSINSLLLSEENVSHEGVIVFSSLSEMSEYIKGNV